MASPLILGRTAKPKRAMGFADRVQPADSDLVTYCGDGHLISFAPTGTGKTSGPVITNALRHPGQLIVLDMKGEVYAATADARRAMGQEVHVLDLRDDGLPGSLNPLDLAARSGTDPAATARSFAAELIERGAEEKDRFWNDWAESMITGAVTHLLAHPAEERTMGKLFDLFNGDDVTYAISVLLDTKPDMHRAARAAFAAFLQLPDQNTRPSVLGTVQTHVRLFDSDLTRRLTDTSSMDVDALIAGELMTIYIIVPLFRLNAYRPLLRLWLSGLIMAMTRRTVQPEHRTLMLVDEAGNLGKVDALLTAATLLRSAGFTLWCFFQNSAQLSLYGAQANTLVDNAAVIQIFGIKNNRMATDLANLIGGVAPDELMKMRQNEQILLIDGKLQRAAQVRYYEDKEFADQRYAVAER